MHKTVVLNVVGLTPDLLQYAKNLRKLADDGSYTRLHTVEPAVTCTVQSSFATGLWPDQHGCVANGWYFRDLATVWFWRQSNRLVAGEKVWEAARKNDPSFTCANMFWWYNMYSSVDYSVTPRPMYPADGRKIPDVYSEPPELRHQLNAELGRFPLFNFWGPTAGIVAGKWIAAASRLVFSRYRPTMMLIYLPHLDYNLQRLGPNDPAIAADVEQIDAVCGELIDYFHNQGVGIVVLSEYGMHEVDGAVHINRLLREQGWIRVREELGAELLDPGASTAFAVADHQIAHVYVRDPQQISAVKQCLQQCPGIELALEGRERAQLHLDHPRSGEIVALARPDKWFSYYYWIEDDRAPDFARTVDIHRKPGYDPVELFLDPQIEFPALKLGWKLLKKKLGFRGLFDVIPLDTGLVKGSHGRLCHDSQRGPLVISDGKDLRDTESLAAVEIKDYLLSRVFAR